MTTEIDDAITNRVEIEFTYNGLPRVVRPGAHGIHHTTGNTFLRGYQVDGESSSRVPPFWDMFLTEKIVDLVVTERRFSDDPPDYSRDDRHMSTIFTQL
ncbi:hypothetical protein [Aeromicrobium sp. CnD17-E]|uniref:hypothetical protein n=1 Tax=Aeromicrobium sp. CnD17-E TaxID=2954487 RepID=UPI0020982C9B|nr:hypothetical protein [Aeromicrobium sp. CnD17-E]MCO7238699.1 hypothetical protein [Aeromicrobium sp. CnD17-E]